MNSRAPPPLVSLPYMTAWYSPAALASTGARDRVTRFVTQYVDPRALQHVTDFDDPDAIASRYDYSNSAAKPAAVNVPQDSMWIDFAADMGDGFDATYAVAYLLSQTRISPKRLERDLPSGSLLLLGGDLAYPYGSLPNYEKRLLTPFDLASWLRPSTDSSRDVFAVPGNHDWYNGLAAFERIFCGARNGDLVPRRVGAWKCAQHRTYFSIKLPHDWMLWGIDTGGGAYVDVGQLEYFRSVAAAESARRSESRSRPNIILVLHEPIWGLLAADPGFWHAGNDNLLQVVKLAQSIGHLHALIAGDVHHYSRYVSQEKDLQLITAGGGGAYLAPTHTVDEKLCINWPTEHGNLVPVTFALGRDEAGNRRRKALYPAKATSYLLSFKALTFPILNPTFALAVGAIYCLCASLFLATVRRYDISAGRFDRLADNPNWNDFVATLTTIPLYFFQAGIVSLSFAVILVVFATSHILFFAHDTAARTNKWITRTVGLLHGCLHVAGVAFTIVTAIALAGFAHQEMASWFRASIRASIGLPNVPPARDEVLNFVRALLPIELFSFIIGGTVAGYIWSLNLFLCSVFGFGNVDRVFSALKIRNYKSFLKIQVSPDALTIYPLGVRRIPQRWGWRKQPSTKDAAAYSPRRPLQIELIDGPIILPRRSGVTDQEPAASRSLG